METYLESLKNCYSHQANPDNAVPMAQYMRNQFQFLGIKSPEAKRLFRQFTKEHGLPKITDIEDIVEEMWCWPEREYQYVALSLLDKLQKQLTLDNLPLLEEIITTKSWWDTVDSIAIHNVGKLLKQYPDRRKDAINTWR